ncbi:Periplasmic murein peptide-binding protein [bioreactor metagenome]|uniref:Periplasmic murein peptide-binding protein n=1 Tax=bioreactor metagenome TaxID=1076179 RepID=A0A644XBF2_9ZZZZ
MSEWTQNDKIVAVPNEYHYDAKNLGPDSITFKFSDDENAIYNGFKGGDYSFIESVPTDEAATLLANGTMTAANNLGTYFISFQTQKYPFDDARVRQAFTLAIDSRYITEHVTQAGERPATGFVPYGVYDAGGAGSDDFRTEGGNYWPAPATDEAYKANCDKARTLLAEAGYPNGKGFPAVEYLYNTDDRNKMIAEALQSMWSEELGVSVTLSNQDWAVVLQTCYEGNYNMTGSVWFADYNDPSSFLDLWQTGGGNNIAQYSNADFDAAIEAAKSTDVPAERMKALHKAEDILIGQDYALAPIFFYTYCFCIDPNLQGVYYNPLGYFFFGYARMN